MAFKKQNLENIPWKLKHILTQNIYTLPQNFQKDIEENIWDNYNMKMK